MTEAVVVPDPPTHQLLRKIVCVGAGYVGTPTSAVIAQQCPDIEVVVLDISEQRIQAFNAGEMPIHEPGLAEIVRARLNKNLFFSCDLATHLREAELIFVSVNTPTKHTGIGAGAASDLSAWEAAGRSIATYARTPKIVVEKSTVPVRTACALTQVLRANQHPAASFDVLSNPEFLAEGTAISDLTNPDRILIGGEDTPSGREAIKALSWVYTHWVAEEKIITMRTWSAELSKLAANAFLAQRVSSINSIALLCEKTGACINEVSKAIGLDKRIGQRFLTPSVGFGGSCFKKDILNMVYLSYSLGLPVVAEYWLQVIKLNEHQKSAFVTRMVRCMFHTLANKKIAVFGFSFKKDTADVRDTPAFDICASLLEERAIVYVHDPVVTKDAAVWEATQQRKHLELMEKLIFEPNPLEAVRGADAIAVLTEWDCFSTYDYKLFYSLMRKPAFIFDGRLLLDHNMLCEIGFDVRAIGKSATLGAALFPAELSACNEMSPGIDASLFNGPTSGDTKKMWL